MKIKAFFTGAVALLTVAAAFAAPGVTGKWTGHLHIDTSTLPKANTPQQQAQMNQVIESMKKTQLLLNIAAPSSFTLTIPTNSFDKKGHTANGTWKQAGNTLTLTVTKQDGKAANGKGQAQQFTVSKDGKTLTLVAGQGMKAGMIVFTR